MPSLLSWPGPSVEKVSKLDTKKGVYQKMTKPDDEVSAMYMRLSPERRELVDRLILQLLAAQQEQAGNGHDK